MNAILEKQPQQSVNSKWLRVTLVRGMAGLSDTQRRTIRSLGLTRLGRSRVLPNVNPILGQINKVIHFIQVEAAQAPAGKE